MGYIWSCIFLLCTHGNFCSSGILNFMLLGIRKNKYLLDYVYVCLTHLLHTHSHIHAHTYIHRGYIHTYIRDPISTSLEQAIHSESPVFICILFFIQLTRTENPSPMFFCKAPSISKTTANIFKAKLISLEKRKGT